MSKLLIALFIPVFFFTACESSKKNASSTSVSNDNLAGVDWKLSKVHLDATVLAVKNSTAFIKFDDIEKTANGNGGCNNFRCAYTVKEKNITISNVLATKMYCELEREQENGFMKGLEKANRFDFVNGDLQLYNNDKVLLTFTK